MAYVYFTDEQKQRANAVDLVDFLQRQGEQLVRSGREYRWKRYDSVTVRGNEWFRHSRKEGSRAIDFVQQFYDMSFPDAVSFLLGGESGVEWNQTEKSAPPPRKEFALPEENPDMRRVFAYLIKQRFIDRDVLSHFAHKKLIYEDKQYHNAVFVGLDENAVARHAHKRGTYTQGEPYKGNVEGSDPCYSFHWMPPMSKPYADRTRQFYSDKPIVSTFRGEMKTLKSVRIPVIRHDEFPKDMPNQSKNDLLKKFYNIVSMCPNIEIPIDHDCMEWSQIYPESKITVEELGVMINNSQNLLSTMQQEWLNWLNLYIELLALLNKKEYLRDSAIYVNQTMHITSLAGIYKDNIQNEKLKEIYNLVFYPEKKDSIQEKLILKNLNLNHQIFTDILSCEDDNTIAAKITLKVAEQQVLAKKNGTLAPAIQSAFYELFYWMNSNETLAASLFPAIFNDRMSLCSPREQIEHYNFGVQTKLELEKHGASSVNELVQKIEGKYSTYADACLLEIQNETSDILSNKPEEIDETSIIRLLQRNAIQNEQELVWLLHASNYSAEAIQTFLQYRRSSLERAYELVKIMLATAADRILEHLRTKPQIYNLANAKKIAPTVYDGIIKSSQEICIIARPSNNSKVILYYDSEPDYLRKNYELWIVDTNNTMEAPRILTFGDMIKITGIRVIPLRNLFD